METVTQQIKGWIAKEGKGNVWDALNIALARLEAALDVNEQLKEEIKELHLSLYGC